MSRLVCGVGVNDADYVLTVWETTGHVEGTLKQKRVWVCPFYKTWKDMIERCFSEKTKERQPTYKDVTCCEEWLVFSKFKGWMEQQNWEGKQLDKDIIFPDNKVYNPETCAFVSRTTNMFVVACDASRGGYPLGVTWNKAREKFKALCRNPFTKKQEYLGYFLTPEEAHESWRKRKHELAQLVAELETDLRVAEALKKRYSVEEWYPSDVKH